MKFFRFEIGARALVDVREAEVLLWVAQGKSNADVASLLGMSEKTVKQHLGNIFDKLGCENRTSASLLAIEVLAKAQR